MFLTNTYHFKHIAELILNFTEFYCIFRFTEYSVAEFTEYSVTENITDSTDSY